MEVALGNEVLICILHPVESSSEENTLTLAACLWLDNKRFGFLVIELKLEILGVLRQYPCGWEEIIIFRAFALHGLQISSE